LKKKVHNKPHLDVTAGVIWDGDKILITKRPPGSHMEGYWEFPGGKKESGESLEQCLKRELREELGLEVKVTDRLGTICHEYDDRVVRLHSFNCYVIGGQAVARESQEMRWVKARDLERYLFPPPDAKVIKAVLDRLSNVRARRM